MRQILTLLVAAFLVAGCGTRGIDVTTEYAATVTMLEGSPVDQLGATAVAWTGTEYVVAGGQLGVEKFGPDGEPETADDDPVEVSASDEPLDVSVSRMPVVAYDPDTGTWRDVAPAPLAPRARAIAVWTGSEVLVWGGTDRRNGVGGLLDGALYDPATDSWREVPDAPAGTDRSYGLAEVVGDHVVIAAGSTPSTQGEELLVLDLADLTWQLFDGVDNEFIERVTSLVSLGDGTVGVLRERSPARPGTYVMEFVVERFDPATGQVGSAVRFEDPLAPSDDTYTMAAGLLGGEERLLLVLTESDDLGHVYDVSAFGDTVGGVPERAVLVDGLVGQGDDDGFGPRPAVIVDGMGGAMLHGPRGDVTVIDPVTLEAGRVRLEPPSCGNDAGAAIGDGHMLLVTSDCAGPLFVQFGARAS